MAGTSWSAGHMTTPSRYICTYASPPLWLSHLRPPNKGVGSCGASTDLVPLVCSNRFGTWTLANVSVPSLLTRDPSGLSGARRTCWSAHLRTIRCVTAHAHTEVATRTYTHGKQWPSHLQAVLWSVRHCRYQRQLLGHKGAVFAADLDSKAALCCTASGDKVHAY